jgi:hypothetical protein
MPFLVFGFVMIIIAGMLDRATKRKGRRGDRRSGGKGWAGAARGEYPRLVSSSGSRIPDASEQLRIVMASEFKPKRLLNRGEEKVLAALEPIVAQLEPGWRVWTQVSLGEVLDGGTVEAFNTINAKRVDFLLVDADQRPRLAIEYQGQGHHQGAAAARDAVKKEALRRAGVGYGEVFAGDGPAELAQVVARVMAGAGVQQTFGVRQSAGQS